MKNKIVIDDDEEVGEEVVWRRVREQMDSENKSLDEVVAHLRALHEEHERMLAEKRMKRAGRAKAKAQNVRSAVKTA